MIDASLTGGSFAVHIFNITFILFALTRTLLSALFLSLCKNCYGAHYLETTTLNMKTECMHEVVYIALCIVELG